MDLPSNMKFARKMGVFGSHAARLYTNRVFDTYWGQLLTPQIVLFLERTMQDLIIPVTGAKSVQAFLADKSTKVRILSILYISSQMIAYLPKDSNRMLEYEVAAKDYIHSINFYSVHSDKVAKTLSLSRLDIVMHRPHQPPLPHRGLDTLQVFVRENRKPLFMQFRPQVSVHAL